MNNKNIVIAGGGVLGSQIAFQSAYCGYNVTIWSISEDAKNIAIDKINKLKATYIDTINKMDTPEGKNPTVWAQGISSFEEFNRETCLTKVENAMNLIHHEVDMNEAFKNADIIVESIVENLKIKNDFFKKISTIIPAQTIVVTNSSTLLPSKMASFTGRPDKFLALHFANSIWRNNTAEVMAQSKTSEESFNTIMEFANNIKMIALPLHKEKNGYLLNSMLVPFLFAGLDLYVNGISDPENIDKAWTIGTGAPHGPFRILDTVGLRTAYNIVLMYVKVPSFLAPYNFKGMEKLLKKYIDEGKLGKETGEGFYKY